MEKVDSHKVHDELQLGNNAPPWPLKWFQLQLIVQLQVQLHSKVKSKSLHVEFSSAPLSPSSSSHSSSRTLPSPPPTQPKSNSDRLRLRSTPAPAGLPALDDLGCSCSSQLGYKSTDLQAQQSSSSKSATEPNPLHQTKIAEAASSKRSKTKPPKIFSSTHKEHHNSSHSHKLTAQVSLWRPNYHSNSAGAAPRTPLFRVSIFG